MIGKRPTSKFVVIAALFAGAASWGVAIRGIMAAPPPQTANDASAKNKILNSPAWRQAMEGFKEWLSAQAIYTKGQLPQVLGPLNEKIGRMSAPQLQAFLADMQQKVTLITSPAAYKAQADVLYNINVASDALAARLRTQLPNLVTMTADQVKQTLYELQQQENQTRADEAAFQQSNAQELATIRAMNQRTADADAAAEASMAANFANGASGPYVPRNPMPQYNPAPIYTGWAWPW